MNGNEISVRERVLVVPSSQTHNSSKASVEMSPSSIVSPRPHYPTDTVENKSKLNLRRPRRQQQPFSYASVPSPAVIDTQKQLAVRNPSMPAPKFLLKKSSSNQQQRCSLQASAPEFVPKSLNATSNILAVNPLGTTMWPSLPKPADSTREIVTPKNCPAKVSPTLTKPSPKTAAVDSLNHSQARSSKAKIEIPRQTNAMRTDSSASHSSVPSTTSALAVSKALPVVGPPVNAEGSHFDLLRLYQEGKLTAQKGRQRLTPRKKKFSSLKKKVLDERLRQWKALQGISETEELVSTEDSNDISPASFTTLCVYGFCTFEELSDDDEYDEIIENLRAMASKIGGTKRVFVPRLGTYDEHRWPVFVQFEDNVESNSHAATSASVAAVKCWTGLVLGGQTLSCRPMPNLMPPSDDINTDDETNWRNACLKMEASWAVSSMDPEVTTDPINTMTVLLDNALTEDDLDDNDCLDESLHDIRSMASKYGEIESLQVVKKDDILTTQIRITYKGNARRAVMELNQMVIAGEQLVAKLEAENSSHGVRLQNIITDDDLEDESCLEESLHDVRELATRFGRVQNVEVEKPSDESQLLDTRAYSIQLYFSTMSEAETAAAGFDGMIMGGNTITAVLLDQTTEGSEGNVLTVDNVTKSNGREPMYSGDKLVPERFAECKRAPKVANHGSARPYAKLASDETIKPTIVEMLSELMRLQRRAVEENNVKAKRRLVLGLREVARGIRSHKVKLVIMANNLDEYGVIDATVQNIIDLAQKEEVPIYYELNKKALGKAVGKSIKVAVVGIQSADGAHQQYKKLISYASKFG